MMGPEDNTPEWDKQVEMITTAAKTSYINTPDQVDQLMLMYAFDESFSRSAILQARHLILNEST